MLAGSITKAFQLLRAAQSEFHSIEELATYLETLLDERTEFDGVPVRPYERSVVRVMNLHKAKGLEAPIVFLADPTGRWAPPVTLHIDRVGDNVKGYMVVYESLFGWSPPVLAKPHGWDTYGAEEKRFEDAEDTRMLYVAATRAGTQLSIVQHEDTKANNRNYWKFFQPYVADAAPLNDPGPQHVTATQHTRVDHDDVRRSIDEIKARWDSACEPSYGTVAAKEIAISAAGLHRPPTAGEHGTEWGTVIHFLLETAMRQPAADLHDLAYAALEEQGLELARVDEAIGTVNSVMQSDLWRRAHASEKLLVEVPFQRCIPANQSDQGRPTVLRGVIDLAFREAGAWVIVDYKTDAAAATGQGQTCRPLPRAGRVVCQVVGGDDLRAGTRTGDILHSDKGIRSTVEKRRLDRLTLTATLACELEVTRFRWPIGGNKDSHDEHETPSNGAKAGRRTQDWNRRRHLPLSCRW